MDSIEAVFYTSGYFHLPKDDAKRVLGEVHRAVKNWKRVARSATVGTTDDDLEAFAPAFEHAQMKIAATLL